MDKIPQKILVSGYGWTGSSALAQMFGEYETISVVPNEFDDFRTPGAIGDAIHNKLNNQDLSISPSRRFKVMKKWLLPYIFRGLVPDIFWPKSFRGGSFRRKESLKLVLNLVREKVLYRRCLNAISEAQSEKEVFEVASDWIGKVSKMYIKDSKFIVFDQPIIYDCHEEYWPKVFDKYKLILLSRNPLDQMGSILRDAPQLLEAPNWYVRFLYGRDSYVNRPLGFFMETTLNRYKLITETYNRVGPNNMIVVQFESLVKNYEATKKNIENFIGIDSKNHCKAFKFFKPDESRIRLEARQFLCNKTYNKAKEMEIEYLKMIDNVNAI